MNFIIKEKNISPTLLYYYLLVDKLQTWLREEEKKELLSIEQEIADQFCKPIISARNSAELEETLDNLLPAYLKKSMDLTGRILSLLANEGRDLQFLMSQFSTHEAHIFSRFHAERLGDGSRVRLRFSWRSFLAFESTIFQLLSATPSIMHEIQDIINDEKKMNPAIEDPQLIVYAKQSLLLMAVTRDLLMSKDIAAILPVVIESLFHFSVLHLESLENDGMFLDPLDGLAVEERKEIILGLSREVYEGLTDADLESVKPVPLKFGQ